MTDSVGHGTFVTGLIAAVDGNGIGGKGVAGNTRVIADPRLDATATSPVASCCAASTSRSARRRRAQHEPGRRRALTLRAWRGRSASPSSTTCCRWRRRATPVRPGTRSSSPRRCSAARAARPGIGLSVGATKPDGTAAPTSPPTTRSSASRHPGASPDDCTSWRALDAARASRTEWDIDPQICPLANFVPRRRGSLRVRAGHELRGPDRLGDRRAHLAGRAAAGVRAGGRGADPLGAPDGRQRAGTSSPAPASSTARPPRRWRARTTSPRRARRAGRPRAAAPCTPCGCARSRTAARPARAGRPRDLRVARVARRRQAASTPSSAAAGARSASPSGCAARRPTYSWPPRATATATAASSGSGASSASARGGPRAG